MGIELIECLSDWFASKKALAKARLESKLTLSKARTEAREKLYKSGEVGDIAWSSDDLSTSYLKNNILTGIISLPLLMAWFPETAGWVEHGFNLIEHMPVWYQAVAGTCLVSTFGVDKFKDIMSYKNGTKQCPPTFVGDDLRPLKS